MKQTQIGDMAVAGQPVVVGEWLASTAKQGAKADPKNPQRMRKWGMLLHTIMVANEVGEFLQFAEDAEKFDAVKFNAEPPKFKRLQKVVLVLEDMHRKDFKLGGAVKELLPLD